MITNSEQNVNGVGTKNARVARAYLSSLSIEQSQKPIVGNEQTLL